MKRQSKDYLGRHVQRVAQMGSRNWLAIVFLCGFSLLFSGTAPAASIDKSKLSSRIAALPAAATPEPCNLDFDGNGTEDALTDGILFMRYLSGYTDAALVDGALGTGATRTTGADITAFLDQADCTAMKDIDGDGTVDAATDGLLMVRYLFGFSGQALIQDALATNAKRTTGDSIQNWAAFYQQPRYIIINDTINPGELISDQTGDINLKAVGTTPATVIVTEGKNYGGNPIFQWNLSGGAVDIALPDATSLTNGVATQTQQPITAEQQLANVSDTCDIAGYEYPIKYRWSRGVGFFNGSGNRVSLADNKEQGGTVLNSMTIDIEALHGVDDTYELRSVYPYAVDVGCISGKEPILFVHGYNPGIFGFGGEKGTWNKFPALLEKEGYLPFEFQWKTSARFQDVAKELGDSIELIAKRTGRKVHVIAHSFGGVLTRVLLQKFAYDGNIDFSQYVSSVVTLGSPHSGIAEAPSVMHGVALPGGQDSPLFKLCRQISCYQMGENVIFTDAAKNGMHLHSTPGYIAAQLSETVTQLPNVKILALIGLTSIRMVVPRVPDNLIDSGDGLISARGQRFLPALGATVSGGSVTERWLDRLMAPFGDGFIEERVLSVYENILPKPGDQKPNSFTDYKHSDSITVLPGSFLDSEPYVEDASHDGYASALAWVKAFPADTVEEAYTTFIITLRTVDDSNQPVSNALINVTANGSDVLAENVTDANGHATLTVTFWPNAVYRLHLEKSGTLVTIAERDLEHRTSAINDDVNLGDILLVSPSGSAIGSTIQGAVTDANSGTALTGVSMSLRPVAQPWDTDQVMTDATGAYLLNYKATKEYVITLTKPGYQTLTKNLLLILWQDVAKNFALVPGQSNSMHALNDTGTVTCSDGVNSDVSCPASGFPGQDAEYGRDVTHNDDSDGHAGFSFTKLDVNGNLLPPSATQWSCVKDNVTGLIWEVKTDNGGMQDKDNTYTWYNTDNSVNGGNSGLQNGGVCIGSNCDAESYVQAINTLSLCGRRNWRLPTVEESHSLWDYSCVGGVYMSNMNYFNNAYMGISWTSLTHANYNDRAWFTSSSLVDCSNDIRTNPKSSAVPVRLVSGN